MAWIDRKKAYDMVLQSCHIIYKISGEKFIENIMERTDSRSKKVNWGENPDTTQSHS